MRRRATAVLIAVLAVAAGSRATAECARPADADVAVGIRNAPPFITDDPIRGRRGLNVDLWTSIERELQADGRIGKTAFVVCPLGDQLRALAAGTLDVVISPLTITAERMDRFDFTHQYLSSGITVARRTEGGIDFGYATGILRQTLGQRGVPAAIVFFLSANLLLAMALRLALRREAALDDGAPPPRLLGGLAVELVVRTIGLKGMGDARSTGLRALEIFMAVVGAALSATVFGVLTTALVGSIGGSRDLGPGDLAGMRVATLIDFDLAGAARGADARGAGGVGGTSGAGDPGRRPPARAGLAGAPSGHRAEPGLRAAPVRGPGHALRDHGDLERGDGDARGRRGRGGARRLGAALLPGAAPRSTRARSRCRRRPSGSSPTAGACRRGGPICALRSTGR